MKRKHSIWFLGLILILQSCSSVDLLADFDPESLSRQVGPKGGKITFYSGSIPQDIPAAARVLVAMDIPAGALNEEVVFEIENVGTLGEPLWFITPDVSFNMPIDLSFRVPELDSARSDIYCYYKPAIISSSGDTTELDDFDLNHQTNLATIQVRKLGSTYTLLESLPFSMSYYTQNYIYCSSTNQDFLVVNLSLGGEDGYADNNFIYVEKESVIPPGFISVSDVGRFSVVRESDLYLFSKFGEGYQELLIDGIVMFPLATQFGRIFSVELNNLSPEKQVEIYTEPAPDYNYDFAEKFEFMSFYRVDLESKKVLEKLPLTWVRSDPMNIFKTEITKSGTYLIGIPIANFGLILGGKVTMQATGAGNTFQKVYESTDVFGADLFCIGNECLYDILVNAENGQGADASEKAEFSLYHASNSSTMEVNSSKINRFTFDDGGTIRTINLRGGAVNSFDITTLEKEVGGNLKGRLTTSGYDSSGNDYTVSVDFELKVYKVYEQ